MDHVHTYNHLNKNEYIKKGKISCIFLFYKRDYCLLCVGESNENSLMKSCSNRLEPPAGFSGL